MTKVFISGLGAKTALAGDVDQTWQGILEGQTGISAINQWDMADFPFNKGAEVKNYKARELVKDRKLLKLISRLDVLGLAAADEAIERSGLSHAQQQSTDEATFNERTGVYVGSPGNKFFQQYDFMPLLSQSKQDMTVFADKLFETVHPMWLLKILPNNVLAYTGIQHGFKGANQNVTNHVVGGIQALIEAFYAIKQGIVDRVVVTSYDVGFEPQAQRYYGQLGILSNEQLRPFDANHNGTILGEGAAAVVLESERSLNDRGGVALAEMLAGQTTGDAQGIFSVDDNAQGIMALLQCLSERSQVELAALSMLTAHGNGNIKSDITESLAYHELVKDVPIASYKWALGHTLCASGLMDVVMTCKSLESKLIAGHANFEQLSPQCAEINISSQTRDLAGEHAFVINRGFGGLNAGVALKTI